MRPSFKEQDSMTVLDAQLIQPANVDHIRSRDFPEECSCTSLAPAKLVYVRGACEGSTKSRKSHQSFEHALKVQVNTQYQISVLLSCTALVLQQHHKVEDQ